MKTRFLMGKVYPKAYQAVVNLNDVVSNSSIDKSLQELIKIRVSQINGCAYCIDLHTKDARKKGETEQRIYALSAWKESNFFTEKEKSVLALTEAITLINKEQVPDDIYNEVEKHFNKEEIAQLIMSIITINAFNRIAISTRVLPRID
ncbi:carboxymuconolactone decarboxylase family protein [Paenibacillus sp. GXUN7292]|uniref:carboxymuconolactone decarboxylase family protein n=1 Tax=Paenibacillus sp. GXUN7292 TaxID=3422499 RepID=UPI003D7D4B7B